MSDNNEKNKNNEKDEKKEGIEKFYELDKQLKKPDSLNFIEDAKITLQRVQVVKQKLQMIKMELEKKVAELKKQVASNMKKGDKGDKPKDMTEEDLNFCERALEEHPYLVAKNKADENTLTEIISTKTEKPYEVIIDVALKPLPSDRNKDKDKDKDKNNNKNNGKGKDKDKDNSNKLTKAQLNQLRMGKPLSYKPENKENTPKSPQSEKDMLLMMKQRNLQAQNR